jgi:drug/metabolite transporter (DMT)-like permease
MARSEDVRVSRLPLAPVGFLLLWASGFVFLKIGLVYAEPLSFLALRYFCVLAILLPLVLIFRPARPATVQRWLHLAMVGLLIHAGYFSFAYLSLAAGLSASGLALVSAQQPILIGLLAPLVTQERVGRLRWAGLGLGVFGASLVIVAQLGQPQSASAWAWLSAGLALLAMVAGNLWEKRYGGPAHPLLSNLLQYTVGLVVVVPLAWALESQQIAWHAAGMWGALLYLVLGNSLLAISLLLSMLRHGEATQVSALFFLVPPLTALLAFAVLDEPLSATAGLGMLLAALGIYLVTRRPAGA